MNNMNILNSFSMKDQKRFLDEACKGKSFDEVLVNFKLNRKGE